MNPTNVVTMATVALRASVWNYLRATMPAALCDTEIDARPGEAVRAVQAVVERNVRTQVVERELAEREVSA
jgi:hypothetical protein